MKDTWHLYTDLAWLWPMWGDPATEYAHYCEHVTALVRQYSGRPATTLLDIGCGGGKNVLNLKRDFNVTGLDVSPAMLAQAKALNPECAFVHGDMRAFRLNRRLASDIVLATASLSHFAALRLLAGSEYLKAFQEDQRQSLALLAMKLHGDGYAISLVFFGFACVSLGYLVFRSGYLPRTIGALLAVAGACYLVNSCAHFLLPVTGAALFNAGILLPCFVAELSLTLCLLIKGVNVARWEDRASGEVAAR